MLSSDPSKTTSKYKCVVSGDKRMSPCAGCPDPKNCMSTSMQYKENEEMDEKAVVKIGSDGSPVKCAVGGSLDQCGYKGGKVCGKCGAMAVEVKKTVEDVEEEEIPGEPEMDYDMPKAKGQGGGSLEEVAEDRGSLEDDDDDDIDAPKKKYMGVRGDALVLEDRQRRKDARSSRLATMGVKSADVDDDAYVCGISRKMHPGAGAPCAGCTGGCAPEADLPTLLEVEGIAEDTFGGKVLTSGYSDLADMFLVDLRRKDGRTFEVLFDGTTAEALQWSLLRGSEIDEKSLENATTSYIGFDEAVAIAKKSVEGDVIGVDVDQHEGFDVYAIAIDGFDGKSYDVMLAVDGELVAVKGYDMVDKEPPTADDNDEAEGAPKPRDVGMSEMDDPDVTTDEKADYSDEDRMSMAEQGLALTDGSFPIKDVADLKNAIQAFGRAGDKAAVKAHIMKRAEALDAMDMIPAEWSEKSEEHDFMATLMEFELLTAEEDLG
jgi:hypothetical protein